MESLRAAFDEPWLSDGGDRGSRRLGWMTGEVPSGLVYFFFFVIFCFPAASTALLSSCHISHAAFAHRQETQVFL